MALVATTCGPSTLFPLKRLGIISGPAAMQSLRRSPGTVSADPSRMLIHLPNVDKTAALPIGRLFDPKDAYRAVHHASGGRLQRDHSVLAAGALSGSQNR